MKAVYLLALLFLNQINYGSADCGNLSFLLHGKCYECDNEIYGQIGCKGNCDGTNYKKNRVPLCEKGGCKEGYYNLNGFCLECDIGSPGCSICTTYEVQETGTEGNFICLECKSNEYKLTEKGTCEKCEFENCERCHYNKDNNVECDECKYFYYKNQEGKCQKCRYIYIDKNKYCEVCSDDDKNYDKNSCRCDYRYTFDDKFALNSDKKCIYCGTGCNYCILDDKNIPYCLTCDSGYLLEGGNCLDCSTTSCSKCKKFKEDNFNEICSQCKPYFYLINSNSCQYCGKILKDVKFVSLMLKMKVKKKGNV